MPTIIELNESDVLTMTPDGHSWGPHCSAYANNEENMMDWNGQMIEPKYRTQIMLQDIPKDELMISDTHISSIEMTRIDVVASASSVIVKDMYEVPPFFSGVASVLSSIYPVLDPVMISNALEEQGTIGIFASAIGSMNAHSEKYLFDLSPESSDEPTIVELDLDSFFASVNRVEDPKGISADQLSKFCMIDLDSAKITLSMTTQSCKRSDDTTLSRNYSTND